MTTLGLYFHIPFCRSKCGYCSFISGTNHEKMREYHQSILKNIVLHSTSHKEKTVDSIYFGGGTPSVYFDSGIKEILDAVRAHFNVSKDCEISAEANPESLTAEKAAEWAAAGVNRVSIGLQSADDDLLKAIGRPHKFADFCRAYDAAVNAGFKNISADIMLGLPNQTVEILRDTIKVFYKSPFLRHLSIYALKLESGTPMYADYAVNNGKNPKKTWLPDEDAAADMYDCAYKLLTDAGFARYEVSNFANSGFECRHNLKYWNLDEYLGIGVAAHSCYGGKRYAETEDIDKFIAGKKPKVAKIRDEESRTEYIMLKLRQEKGINLGEFNKMFNYDLSKTDGAKFLSEHGLIDVTHDTLSIKKDKFYIMNSIILKLNDF